jgi:hypothetical protein
MTPLLTTVGRLAPASIRTVVASWFVSVATPVLMVPMLTSCGVVAPDPRSRAVALPSNACAVIAPPLKMPPSIVVECVPSAEPAIFRPVAAKPTFRPVAVIVAPVHRGRSRN